MSLPIPQPPGLPLIGNILDFNPADTSPTPIHALAQKYGPIFKLSFFGKIRYFVTGYEVMNELSDERRFMKAVDMSLVELRPGVGQGLFTAETNDHDWEVAHRTLVPAFGPLGIKHMFDEMYDVASQMIAKMAREGPDQEIDVPDMFTRLTLDSIALCAMDYRFNSFYHEQLHPFVVAMVRFLSEGQSRVRRTRIQSMLNPAYQRQFEADIALMRDIANEVVERRRKNPSEKPDLLNAMLLGKDPKTGEHLSQDSVINNMITFLIAGHETTSGLLSFATYYILKNPETYRKAQEEVGRVVGKNPVKFEHISKLPYIDAVLRETLRLTPTAPGFFLKPRPDLKEPAVICGGKYLIPNDAVMVCVSAEIHRDPAVWGEDAEKFNPEHFYGENWNKLPPNTFKAFGTGVRSCIGRGFAWQEAILALAMVLQNFDLRLADPSYEMIVKRALSIKPDNLYIKASLRKGLDPVYLEKRLFSGPIPDADDDIYRVITNQPSGSMKPFHIFFGGNSGTCESLAQTLAGSCKKHGYLPSVKSLDEAAQNLPTKEPVVIITASYEGLPPDNAGHFVEWLKTTKDKLGDVDFCVFGVGHHDWASTYQRIPRLVHDLLIDHGAEAIPGMDRAECDVALGTIFDEFDAWQKLLWQSITGNYRLDAEIDEYDMEISTSARAGHLNHIVHEAIVLENKALTPPNSVPEKRHMSIRLPTNMDYKAGDYLAVLPVNPHKTVHRVLRRFGLPWDAEIILKEGSHTTIPVGQPLSVTHVLSTYVELTQPATKKAIFAIQKFANTEAERETIDEAAHRCPVPSVLEILEAAPMINVPFSTYLAMLQTMRIRQYSISSSPLTDPSVASITYSILKESLDSGDEGAVRLGVATNYLASLSASSKIQISIKKSHAAFHLPTDDRNIPVIMIGAGTGIAPFLGFIAERAAKIQASKEKATNVQLAEAVLFYGCRNPDEDLLYKTQIAEWESIGAVKLYPAFSRASEKSEGCKYAQDRLWHERDTVSRLFISGARCYICGSRRLGQGVEEVGKRIHTLKAKELQCKDLTTAEADEWWERLRNERYAVDVFD